MWKEGVGSKRHREKGLAENVRISSYYERRGFKIAQKKNKRHLKRSLT